MNRDYLKGVNTKQRIKKGSFFRMLSYNLHYKFQLLLVGICFVFSMLASIATGVYMQILIDKYIADLLQQKANGIPLDFNPLIISLVKYAAVLFAGVLTTFLYQIIMVYVSQGTMKRIREDMFAKMEKLPLKYFDMKDNGDVMSRYTSDLDTMRQSLSQSTPQAFAAIFAILVIFGTMIYLSINLTLVVTLVLIIVIVFTKIFSGISLKANINSQDAVGKLNAYVEEMVNGAKEIKAFCYEDENKKRFDEKNVFWKDNVRIADTVGNVIMPINNGLGNITYIAVALIGGYMCLSNVPNFSLSGNGVLSIGVIAGFLTYTKRITHEIANVSNQIPYILQSMSGSNRIFDLLDEEDEIDNGDVVLLQKSNDSFIDDASKFNLNSDNEYYWNDNDKKIKLAGDIVLDSVCFSYQKDKPILKEINIYAQPGQKVALVGKTGAGKTTITNLINRFYDIDSGIITYDGIDINRIRKKSLRNGIGLVLQDVNLFSGTILENIRYGNLNATDEECIEAAKKTYASLFIEQLEDGYNTIVTGDSGGLSQGQKQLLSIARAYVANPPLLILDEATSSIDTRTEKLVQDGMDELMKGRTVFVIAHRLSTIKNSDVIMVMDDGQIIERGNHESLMAKKGRYYELYTGKIEME